LKAAAFDYIKAGSIAQVIDLLVRHGDDARVLAGGQTLMATLNMRLSEPALVIDITGLQSLRGIELRGEVLRIGALATHTQIEQSALVARHAPLLAEAAPHIAHRAIRNSGTWGGSIAYADPAAEWPACLLALGGTVIVQGPDGERRIAADDFFTGLYATALRPEEIITASELPIATAGQWQGMSQLARRHVEHEPHAGRLPAAVVSTSTGWPSRSTRNSLPSPSAPGSCQYGTLTTSLLLLVTLTWTVPMKATERLASAKEFL